MSHGHKGRQREAIRKMEEKRDVRKWTENYGEVLAFARVLFDHDYFGVDVDPPELMLSYFEKPWKWTAEYEKYQAWRTANPDAKNEHLPLDFFDGEPKGS